MNYYRVLLLGENFFLRIEGCKKMMGFYKNCFVSSENPEQAELRAVEMVKNEKKLKDNTLNKSWQKQPMIYLEEIYEIEKSEMEEKSGFSFFEMDDKS